MFHGDRQVLVTGLGVISPVGLTVSKMWEALVSGRSGVDYISSFNPTPFETRIAAEVKSFDPGSYVTQKQARHMDRFTQFAVAASLQAVEAAQLTIRADNAEETGVIIGNSVCGLLSVAEQLKVLNEMGPRRVSPVLATTMTGDAASVQVSLILGAKGVNYSPSSSCCSGSDAIGQAYDLIRHGDAKVIVAGGTEAPITPLVLGAFGAVRAMSTRNDNPQAACRPFDAERNGFVLGEGAAMVVLEDATCALARGAPILAEIVGYGATNDLFLAANVPGNLANLWRWTIETRGYWTLLGLGALAWTALSGGRRAWPWVLPGRRAATTTVRPASRYCCRWTKVTPGRMSLAVSAAARFSTSSARPRTAHASRCS